MKLKIVNGTITSDDLPASIKGEFPAAFVGMSLNEIRLMCSKKR